MLCRDYSRVGNKSTVLKKWGGRGKGAANFENPSKVEWLPATATREDQIIITDTNNDRVQLLTLSGGLVRLVGFGTGEEPEFVSSQNILHLPLPCLLCSV